ncbi:hypothetical protein [Parasitella parasitica]|uniref:UBZ4-type domain-containing protein n=1 Tax=Parasitella parasitica TaxID=35722 RepID=A0A0B7N978_9FUNG|nr:hypothetical protein [Parasitella parasitica]
MVLSNKQTKKANLTIDELFKRPISANRRTEDEDLLLAMRLSQQEHLNEQKKLLEQYALLSQKQFENAPSHTIKKKRLIKPDPEEHNDDKMEDFTDDDDDQWFQTVSIRPQPPVKKAQPKSRLEPRSKYKLKVAQAQKKAKDVFSDSTKTHALTPVSTFINKDTMNTSVKRENDEILLEVDDVDRWLDAKIEKTEESNMVEITDIDAFLDQVGPQPQHIVTIDEDAQEELRGNTSNSQQLVACPLCQRPFQQGKEIQEHAARCNNMISDSDSDSNCDVIDLINPANNSISKQTDLEKTQEEEDDGYLSPLEGFTSIQNGENEAFNPYFEQLQPKPKKTRASRGPRKPASNRGGRAGRGGGRNRFKWYKKKKS